MNKMADESCFYYDTANCNGKDGWELLHVCLANTEDLNEINLNNYSKCNAEDYQKCKIYQEKVNGLEKEVNE